MLAKLKIFVNALLVFSWEIMKQKLASFVDIVKTEVLQYAPFLWANMASSEKTHAGLLTFLKSTQNFWGNNSWSC